MVVGVKCQYHGEISLEKCIECASCLPAPYIRSLKQHDYPPTTGKYGVKELIGCLRQAHYKRTIGIRDEYKPLNVLWMMKRGGYLGNIAHGTGYNELEGFHKVKVDSEIVQIRGKLDCYDHESKTIIETKTTKLYKDFEPREEDILQLQCYVTLYRTIFLEIRGLRLVYLDLYGFKTFDIDMVNQANYLEQRVTELHRSIVNGEIPDKEDSRYCKYCQYKTECDREINPLVVKEIVAIGEKNTSTIGAK